MPISATAWRTSSTLNGLITAVINFTRLSPLAPLNPAAAAIASAYYDSSNAASMPGQPCRKINGLGVFWYVTCTISVRMTTSVRYPGAINTLCEVPNESAEFKQLG
jgi:hypothetical protein